MGESCMHYAQTFCSTSECTHHVILSPEHTGTCFISIFPWFQLGAKTCHERILTVYIMADIGTSSEKHSK